METFSDAPAPFVPGYRAAADAANAAEFPAPTPAGLNFSLTDIANSMAAWDWHQWALLAVGGYVVYRGVSSAVGGASRAARSVTSSIRRRRSAHEARRKRISSARKRYEEAREGSGFFGGLLGA